MRICACTYVHTYMHVPERTVEEDFRVGKHLEQPRLEDTHLTTVRGAAGETRMVDRAALFALTRFALRTGGG